MRTFTLFSTFIAFRLTVVAQTWQPLNLPTNNDILSSSFISDEEGWIGIDNAHPTSALLHTANGGATWNFISIPAGSTYGTCYVQFISSQKGFAVMNEKAFKTIDAGSTWTQLVMPGTPVGEPFFLDTNIGYIGGTACLYKTTDGGNSWTTLGTDIFTDEVSAVYFLDENHGVAQESEYYVSETFDGGATWILIGDASLWTEFHGCTISPAGDAIITGGYDSFGDIYAFVSGSPYSYQDEDIENFYGVQFDASGKVYAAGDYGTIVSSMDGTNWDKASTGSFKTLYVIDGYHDLYAFGDDGEAYKLDASSSSCLPPDGLTSESLSASSQKFNWNNAVNAIGYKLRYKISGSSAWTKLHAVTNNKVVQNLLPNTEYVWQVRSICTTNPIAQSSWSAKSFFTTPLRMSDDLNEDISFIVYPNPVTDLVNIRFSLTESSAIKLELMDMSGKKIKTIAEANFSEGNHQLQFERDHLPPGIYLVQLNTNVEILNQKLIIQ